MRLASTSSECSRKAEPPTLHDWRASELPGSLAVGNTLSFWKLWDIHKRPSVPHLPLAHGRGARRRGGRALSRSMLRALEKLPRVCGRIENVRAWLSRLTIQPVLRHAS